MVEKARRIVEDLGGQIEMSREARDIIGLSLRLANAKPPALAGISRECCMITAAR